MYTTFSQQIIDNYKKMSFSKKKTIKNWFSGKSKLESINNLEFIVKILWIEHYSFQ